MSEVEHFPCATCGLEVTFHPADGTLTCAACGRREEIPASYEDFQEYPLDSASRLTGRPAGQLLQCSRCGAATVFAGHVTAAGCPFCGCRHVFQAPGLEEFLQPESIIPFKVEREEAIRGFRAWLGSLWFRPRDLRKMGALGELQGIYLPFWCFSALASSVWKAEAGEFYEVDEAPAVMGGPGPIRKSQKVQKVRWSRVGGNRAHHYKEVLVSASAGLGQAGVSRILPFDLAGLVAYRPEYLSGWDAERYSVDVQDGWTAARSLLEERIRSSIASSIQGDTHRHLSVKTVFNNIGFKHSLLPVYIAPYRYRKRTYLYLVNGQTGKTSGEAPLSIYKIALFVLALALLAWLLMHWMPPEVPPGGTSL